MLPTACRCLSRRVLSAAADMPKTVDLTERRDARSAKNKKLKSFGPPSSVKLQVLGTGAEGAPRSLYVFTTSGSYLFNCGEGTQRLSHERKTRLARLENIFVTANAWRNVGGVLGALLTLNDIGVPALSLHGPPGLSSLYRDTCSFIQLRGMDISHRSQVNEDFVDSGLTVRAVPLWGAAVHHDPAASADQPAVEQVDYFAYERTGGSSPASPRPARTAAARIDEPPLPDRAVSYAYLCSVPDRPGRLLLERCVSRGVPPGPLLGRLKNGHDVVLEDGSVVKSSEVTSPDEIGAQFIVLELPSADFLPSLAELDSSVDAARLAAVVHFSPPAVMDSPEYRGWLGRLPAGVRHVALNARGRGHGSEAVHRLQYQLHAIDADLFPLLAGDHTDTELAEQDGAPCKRARLSPDCEQQSSAQEQRSSAQEQEGSAQEQQSSAQEQQSSAQEQEGSAQEQRSSAQEQEGSAQEQRERRPPQPLHPPSGWGLSLRPLGEPDMEGVVPVTPDVYRAELAADAAFAARLAEYRRAVAALPAASGGVFPQTVFLGTGSSIPNKKRNTSGILVNLSEEHAVLLDCGEGTHGQLVRLVGSERTDQLLRRLHTIYISHMHADHHIGLISVLEARRRALGADHHPCLLLAPAPIAGYLTMYHTKMAPVLDMFTLVTNERLLRPVAERPGWLRARLSAAGLAELRTCRVRHCPLAYGVRLSHDAGPALVYSGDTRPCEELITLGQGCDLLIHEATHEDELQDEAELRAHSTTSEAIEVGRRMDARHVILTHFSQRYSNLPLLPDPPPHNVGVAYDNMVVDFSRLPRLPLVYPSLKQAFAESYDLCVERTAKRRDRKQKLADQLASGEAA